MIHEPPATVRCYLAGLIFVALGCEHEREIRQPVRPPAATGLVRMSRDAQKAVGIQLAEVKRMVVGESLAATGWLMAAPDREIVIKAPVPGFITAGALAQWPKIGMNITSAGAMAEIQVVLAPQEQAQIVAAKEEADAIIRQSKVSMEIAATQLQGLKDARDAVSGVRLAALQETYERSKAAYEEGLDRLPFLPEETEKGRFHLKPREVSVPLAGNVVAVHVAPRQFVAQGDPLWTVADWSRLWVRVPVFEMDLPRVLRDQPAQVQPLGERTALAAQPISAVQPTRAGGRLVDCFYELANVDGKLRAGQAVNVSLPIGGRTERSVIPQSAVLWDGLGNAAVYVQTAAEQFRRQKIELSSPLADGTIAVERGLSAKEMIVAVGAQAIYGEEFKFEIPVEENEEEERRERD